MISSQRSCRIDPDMFYYIYRQYTFKDQRKGITNFVRKAYLAYFKVKLGDQDKAMGTIYCMQSICRKPEKVN